MTPTRTFVGAAASLTLAITGHASAQTAGPDVIVGDVFDTGYFGASNGIHAYALGTVACNIGDHPLDWYANSPAHPVIAQHMYRIHDGRIEQIGLSSVVHTSFALQSNTCGFCTPFPTAQELGVGCSSPNSVGHNASQLNLGPRFEINAATGAFPYPFTGFGDLNGNTIDGRLQVPDDLLLLDGNSAYFVEAQFITADDAQAGANTNNASHREVNVNPNHSLSFAGPTNREAPAIFAWGQHEPDVVLHTVDVAGDGRFHIAGRAEDLGDGSWRYHYAIHNLTSHRSAAALTVPLQIPQVTDPDFHAPHYHSGSPVSNAPWTITPGDASVRWETEVFSPLNEDSANALRFGTTYSFSFTAASPPVDLDVTVHLFRPGSPDSFSAPLPTPGPSCAADFAEPFGALDFSDIAAFLVAFSAMSPQADLAEPFGSFDFSDVAAFLAAFGAGCP